MMVRIHFDTIDSSEIKKTFLLEQNSFFLEDFKIFNLLSLKKINHMIVTSRGGERNLHF